MTAPQVHRIGAQAWVMCVPVPCAFIQRHRNLMRFLLIANRFYEGHSEAGERAIGAAVSRDGVSWTRPSGAAPLLSAPRDDAAWDAGGVGAPFAVPMAAGKWRLYYEGYGAAARGARGAAAPQGIGLALSADPANEADDVTTRPFRRRTAAAY